MAPVMTVQDDRFPTQQPPRNLTTQAVTGPPQQLQVSDDAGLLATLTVGAKTVAMRGPARTFTEQKRTFVDEFARTVSNGFGRSPGGGVWLNLTGTDANFSVDGSQGVIVNDVANTGRYCSIHDDDVADVSASCRITVNAAPTGASSSVGFTFGYQDSSNHYRARLLLNTTGTVQLALEKVAAGTTTTIGAATNVGSGFVANQWWRIRVERVGTTIRCRAWPDTSAEPSTWTFSVVDATFPTGRIGFRSFASTGSTAIPFNTLVDQVAVASAAWAHPPTVTHGTWVRVLDQPFDGMWTPQLADRIRTWAVDTSADALAYAFMYVTGAPDVTDPAFGGKRVFGQSGYGPLAADGSRIEFSDWNDYIGVPWDYDSGEHRDFPHGSITISGCMDCSGLVRQVYRRMGIPLTFDQQFDGIHLPRRSRDIGPSGPGVAVANTKGTSTPAPLTAIQPGDVVLFDADTSSSTEEEGQIDHDGIYVGIDSTGLPRFISSRKTVNGPTMSDLGGSAALTGTGLYARTLRIIRRF